QAPKIQPNPQKAASILAWFHKTAQAHSIKDLEKTLPQVSSINGMQVKDYLQALSDDNKIRVEKIGSGNWYWSFPADEKKAKEAALQKAQEEHAKASAVVAELEAKVEIERRETQRHANCSGADRKALMTKHAELVKEVEALRQELGAYSEQDPVELDKKAAATQQARMDADRFTDQILVMQGWFKQNVGGGGGGEEFVQMLKMLYGDEFDEEEQGLRELV
ncbi:uncharacterized protein SETTUDRAFT_100461, partial [Exserohilum turcica Et28A]